MNPNWWPFFRNASLFLVGLLGVIHETVLAATPDPQLLIIFAAMMGLPAFLKADEEPKK